MGFFEKMWVKYSKFNAHVKLSLNYRYSELPIIRPPMVLVESGLNGELVSLMWPIYINKLQFGKKSKPWEICQKCKFKTLKNTFKAVKSIVIFFLFVHIWPDWFKINKILQYQSILQNPWSTGIFVHPVELVSARMYR